jgi:hypothetical protein
LILSNISYSSLGSCRFFAQSPPPCWRSWGEENPNFSEFALERSACSCLLVLASPPDSGESEDIRNYLRRWRRMSEFCGGIVKRYDESLTMHESMARSEIIYIVGIPKRLRRTKFGADMINFRIM